MDDKLYIQIQDQKYQEYEALCKRCGACCGVLDNDPCEHLKKGPDNGYFCDIYEERFGVRKTVKGKEILCVPIRNMFHKTWWGRIQCAYMKKP